MYLFFLPPPLLPLMFQVFVKPSSLVTPPLSDDLRKVISCVQFVFNWVVYLLLEC